MKAHFLCLFLVACTGADSDSTVETDGTDDTEDTEPATDFMGVDIALDEDCAGIVGLTGQAILDKRTDGHVSTLAYVTAAAEMVDPTEVTVVLTWPDSPVATCYPAWDETPLYLAEARVGIHGLQMSITTADGHYAETMDATAWYVPYQGTPASAYAVGTKTYAGLDGDWVPFPEYSSTGANMDFNVTLATYVQGTVAMGNIPLDRMEAGVFGSRFAVATWPHAE